MIKLFYIDHLLSAITKRLLALLSIGKLIKILGILLTIFTSLTYSKVIATCNSTGNGNWNNSGTWDCQGSPQCGDTIYILETHTVTVSKQEDYSGCMSPLFIIIEGTLEFNNGRKLLLPEGSGILVKGDGLISGSGGGNSNIIEIGNTNVWSSSDGAIDTSAYLGEVFFIEEIISIANGNWETTNIWDCNCIPEFYHSVTIDTNHSVTLNGNMNVGNINIMGTLDASSHTINISGNWNNYSTFVSTTSTVILNGSTPQNIIGNNTFYNLTLSNSSGVSILSGNDSLINTLTIDSGLFNTNNSLTLISNVSSTARIAEITGGSITGDITMQRYIDAGATNWRFITSAISGATLADLNDDFITSGFIGSDFPDFPTAANPFISISYYDETVTGTSDNGFVGATNVTNSIVVGEGLWVWSGDTITGTQPFTIDFTGPANTGNINLPITYTNTGSPDNDGWNMVGNPYPSTINWDDPAITKTNVNNAIYIWNPDMEQFASYVGGIGINGGSRYVASSQAFWIQANAPSPVVQVTEACKDPNDEAFLKQDAAPTTNPLVVNIQNSFGTDQTIINFQTNATTNFDGTFDAYKIASTNPDRPYISSLISNNETEYAINQIPQQETDILIKVLANTSGVHLISFTGITNFSNSCVMLEDLFTGNTYDLATTSSLSAFISDTTTVARFVLKLGAPINTVNNDISCHGSDDGTIFLEKNSTQPFDVVWKNSAGDLIATHTNINGVDSITNLSAGTYIIETTDEFCGNIIDTITLNNPLPITVEFNVDMDTFMLKYNDNINFTNLSNNASSYTWDFDDGNTSSDLSPVHQYQENGVYAVTLTATQNENCFKKFTKNIAVLDNATSIDEISTAKEYSIYPNPLTGNHLNIVFNGPENNSHVRFQLIDISGKMVYQRSIITQLGTKNNMTIKIDRQLPKGSYIVKMITSSNISTQTLIVK